MNSRPDYADLLNRIPTGLPALDYVLGGGLVEGSTTLLAGRPGAGKSTLTLQLLNGLGQPCLLAIGEEPREHVEKRRRRVGALSNQICMLFESRLEEIIAQARVMQARVLAIDTIQTLICAGVKGRAGKPAQLRACTEQLIAYCKVTRTTLWLVNYLTDDGSIAEPWTIQYDVDVVLRLNQEDDARILSPDKNRFGPNNVASRLKLAMEGFLKEDA